MPNETDRRALPLWMKLTMAAFLVFMVPTYWWYYGPANFLWISDIALFLCAITLWTGRREFACTAAVLSLLPELAWSFDFLCGLSAEWHPVGMSAYMWDPAIPPIIRGVSLFHVPLVPLMLYLVWKLGHDRRALWWGIATVWLILPATYLLTDPAKNTNNVFHSNLPLLRDLGPRQYLAAVMVLMPVLFFLPTHLALMLWRGRRELGVSQNRRLSDSG